MISVSLENKNKSETSSYKDRYKEMYVATNDFGVAAVMARKHIGKKFDVTSMSLVSDVCLDEEGEAL